MELRLMQISSKIVQSLYTNISGGTFDNLGNEVKPNKGYAVGLKGFSFPKMFLINCKYPTVTLCHYLIDNFKINKGSYIGFWVSNEICYIDEVQILQDKNEALKLAKEKNQISIFDFETNKEIYLINQN
jgi:hypothetical protein